MYFIGFKLRKLFTLPCSSTCAINYIEDIQKRFVVCSDFKKLLILIQAIVNTSQSMAKLLRSCVLYFCSVLTKFWYAYTIYMVFSSDCTCISGLLNQTSHVSVSSPTRPTAKGSANNIDAINADPSVATAIVLRLSRETNAYGRSWRHCLLSIVLMHKLFENYLLVTLQVSKTTQSLDYESGDCCSHISLALRVSISSCTNRSLGPT